jgi:hypothetical protein
MLCHMVLIRTDVSEERIASIIRMTKIGELGTTLAIRSSETSVLTRATWRNIQEDGILHSICRENLKSYRFCSCLGFQSLLIHPRSVSG